MKIDDKSITKSNDAAHVPRAKCPARQMRWWGGRGRVRIVGGALYAVCADGAVFAGGGGGGGGSRGTVLTTTVVA